MKPYFAIPSSKYYIPYDRYFVWSNIGDNGDKRIGDMFLIGDKLVKYCHCNNPCGTFHLVLKTEWVSLPPQQKWP